MGKWGRMILGTNDFDEMGKTWDIRKRDMKILR